MSSWQLWSVWLFGILMAAVTVMKVSKTRAGTPVEIERLKTEVARAWLDAQTQLRGPTYMPPEWTKDGGL